MKEFVEKLIGRLEKVYDRNYKIKKEAFQDEDWEKFDLFTHRNEGVYVAISIVNQLAEEYNNRNCMHCKYELEPIDSEHCKYCKNQFNDDNFEPKGE